MQIRLEVPKSEMRPPPLCEAISNNDYVRFVEKQYEEVSSACILATERRHLLPSVTLFQHFVFYLHDTALWIEHHRYIGYRRLPV